MPSLQFTPLYYCNVTINSNYLLCIPTPLLLYVVLYYLCDKPRCVVGQSRGLILAVPRGLKRSQLVNYCYIINYIEWASNGGVLTAERSSVHEGAGQ